MKIRDFFHDFHYFLNYIIKTSRAFATLVLSFHCRVRGAVIACFGLANRYRNKRRVVA